MSTHVELSTSRLLDDAGEALKVSEEVVTLCMNPLYLPDYEQEWPLLPDGSADTSRDEVTAAYIALLRTGAIFALDPEEAAAAFESAWEAQVPTGIELPPLPYARVLVEGRKDEKPEWLYAPRDWSHTNAGVPMESGIVLVGINERERGKLWDVSVVVESSWDERLYDQSHFRIAADENGCKIEHYFMDSYFTHDGNDEEAEDWRERMIGLAVTAAHLIVAERVPHRALPVPRAQRREAKRRQRYVMPPHVYFVDLAASGEITPGTGERQYHVRWLVQGHWRLSDSGSTFVRHKGGVCTWVRPYIKGPVGAPWKGRPVYARKS